MNLIIVESPTKARTLMRFLGSEYTVEATMGHVRDLPQKKIGIKIENNFEPEYVQTEIQKKRTEEIKRLSDKAEKVYLATDPDREGEAIAWHVLESIRAGEQESVSRIVFHEITERAIKEALEHPRGLDMQLVDAQQARRILDRLVGYKLSPLLWRKVRKGLSAGRVQSVAVRLVVEREREIEKFVPEEYWVIQSELAKIDGGGKLVATVVGKDGEKLKVANQQEADTTEKNLRESSFKVRGVDKKDTRKTPPPPFTTSTLQQAAANKLGWSAKRAMQVAQSLYEEGLITYHRTDSTNLAADAVKAAADFLKNTYGAEYSLAEPRIYKTKSKVAQEAHEAIRPTDVTKNVQTGGLGISGRDEVMLYELIWRRFTACQAAEAVGEETKVTVNADGRGGIYALEAKGMVMKFAGWLKVYGVDPEENGNGNNGSTEVVLPPLKYEEKLNLVEVIKQQKFTQPPTRYNDAGLIKVLEELGIGRPSTYAPTLSTIQDRQYVEKELKRFKPTSLGIAVNDFLVTNFSGIVDYKFTAKMEDELDEIASGERHWQPVIKEFYDPFEKLLASVQENSARVKIEVEATGEKCPKCQQGDVVIRIGRYGRFLSCNRYPECDYKANFVNKVGIACPKCGGDVILKRTRNKKTFFGCSNYPKCDFASWTRPTLPGASDGAAKLKEGGV